MSRVVMSGRVTSRVVLVSWGRLALQSAAAASLIAACSSAPPPPPAPPTALVATAPVAAEPPACVDANDQRVQCLADSDCCPHFVCGKDPELSQSVNYCIFGG
jgi:Ion channel inhibitory toxin